MDIASLLSRLTGYDEEFLKFAERMRGFHKSGVTDPRYLLPNGVEIIYQGGPNIRGRRFTVSMPSLNVSLRFRFAGHVNLAIDGGGIATFLHPDFRAEFACELGDNLDPLKTPCAPLHALVLNSGQHDLWHREGKHLSEIEHVKHFQTHLDTLLAILAPHLPPLLPPQVIGTRSHELGTYPVIWRGNTMNQYQRSTEMLREMDMIARERVSAVGIPFVDVAAIVSSVPNFPACCSVSMVHFGFHEFGRFTETNLVRNQFTASSLVTNALLRRVCPMPLKGVAVS